MLSRIASLSLVFLLSPQLAFSQDAAVEEIQELNVANVPGFEQMSQTEKALEREFKLLQSATELNAEQIAGLKLGIKPLVAKREKQVSNDFMEGMYLNRTILIALAGAVDAIADDNAKARAYAVDLRRKADFQQEATVASLVESIDSCVGLTSNQAKQIAVVANKLFEEETLSFSFMMSLQSFGSKAQLKPILDLLTERQRGFFDQFEKGGFSRAEYIAPGADDKGATSSDLKATLQDVATMKINRLRGQLGLTPKQVQRLELVSKKIVSNALKLRDRSQIAYDKFTEASENGGAVGRANIELMAVLSASPVHLFETQKDWEKFVAKVLTDEQQTAWKEITDETAKRKRRVLGYMLVMAFQRELDFSGKQMFATHKLIWPRFGEVRSVSMNAIGAMNSYATLLDIKEDQYIAAMGADNWAKFKPQLDQLKTQLDRMGAGIEE